MRRVALAVSIAGAMLLTAGGAQAQPGPAPGDYWCPGQPIPRGAAWNMATCHLFHYATQADGTLIAVPGS
jgi:hypothetical protein